VISTSSICIICEDKIKMKQAELFSTANSLPLYTKKQSEYELQLCYGEEGIVLYDNELNTSIAADFISGTLAHRRQFGGGRGQSIAKAIGLKHGKTPVVIDATAGMARDAFVLASIGCKITLVEQSPILFTLVDDGITRAIESGTIDTIIGNITNLVNSDSNLYLEHMDPDSKPDVIYIDPMFPERKKSALVKKDMRILQKLVGKDIDSDALLETALEHAKNRVVVKRPSREKPVSERTPDTSINGKKTRYDIYLV
jgi:16S rRNA (guanine1516-N2)-methyltransferase